MKAKAKAGVSSLVFPIIGCLSGMFWGALPERAGAVSVNLELMMLVDSSGSIDSTEWEFQRDAIAAAFRNPSVNSLFSSGNQVAVSLYYWAGDAGSGMGVHEQGVDWTLIASAADAVTFADLIDLTTRPDISTMPLAQTAISRAINQSLPLFADNGFEGMRNLIDISGDGTENVDNTVPWDPSPIPVIPVDLNAVKSGLGTLNISLTSNWGIPQDARDAALALGIGINGLAILGGESTDSAFVADAYNVTIPPDFFPDLTLEEYQAVQAAVDFEVRSYLEANHGGETMIEFFYENMIIGSPDGDPEAKLFIAEDNADFADAIVQKLATEIIPEPGVPGLSLVGLMAALSLRRRARS